MSKYFLIHDLVRKKEIFEQACAEDVQCSVVDSISTPTLPNDLTHLGLVYDNTGKKAPFLIFDEQELIQYNEYLESMKNVNDEAPKPPVKSDFLYNSSKFFSPSFMTLITEYKTNNPSFEYLDLITCNVKEELIKSQADELLELGIIVRYSTNFTGKNGDWILESHDVNVTNIYFNTEGSESVKSYPYQLGIKATTPNISTAQQLLDLMQTTNVTELDYDYTLENDIDMDILVCESIGKGNTSFTGTFLGQGHNIYIKNIASEYSGFFGIVFNATIQNFNVIYGDNLTLNSTTPAISNGAIGGLSGANYSSNFQTCNVIFGNNTTFNGTSTDGFANRSVGGLFGLVSTDANTHKTENCNGIFGNNTTFNSQFIGGLAGSVYNFNIENCNVIFGDVTEFAAVGVSSRSGGLFGNYLDFGFPSTFTNCAGIFKDYKITSAATLGSPGAIFGVTPIPPVNNCYTLTFGTPDPSSGVQDMLGPYDGDPTNLENVRTALETSLYSQWLVSLVAIREKLNEDGTAASPAEVLVNNPLYLNNIVGNGEPPLSPDVSLGYKNVALQLSMAYSDTPFINSDFGTIKSLLSTYTTATDFFNGKTIEYLNTPTDNAYTLEKQKFYYIPVSEGTISVDSSTPIPFVTSKSPAGISYQGNFTSIDEIYTKDGVTFTTYGVGSGLIGIDEPTPPVPPTPTTTTEPISWWWVLIILVVLFIVIGLYIYFFKYDHWFNSSPFSKEL